MFDFENRNVPPRIEFGTTIPRTYLSTDAVQDLDAYLAWAQRLSVSDDPIFHAIVDESSGLAVGVAAFLRIDAEMGVIEVGHINFSPALQRTRAATEAMFLMMRRVFDESRLSPV